MCVCVRVYSPHLDIHTVDKHFALLWVVEALYERHEGTLAAATRTDERDLLSGLNLQRKIL